MNIQDTAKDLVDRAREFQWSDDRLQEEIANAIEQAVMKARGEW